MWSLSSRKSPREHLKMVARRLFAERGVDGVTVREIAEAAGQKNHASVKYHFGSKDELVHEILREGAIIIDERRNRLLNELEANGGPTTVREVVEIIIFTALDLDRDEEIESYNRFFVMTSMAHRDLFMDALEGRWNSGYQRCLKHLRRLMPDMPLAMKNQRLVFMGAFYGSVLAARESAMADHSRSHPTWNSAKSLSHLAHSVTAMLEAPPPESAQAAPRSASGSRKKAPTHRAKANANQPEGSA